MCAVGLTVLRVGGNARTYLLLFAPLVAHLSVVACAKDDGKREPDSGAAGSAGTDGSAGTAGSAGDVGNRMFCDDP
ncbi:MAG TPA: hypothetical protein PKA88_07555 [Polyangiaceae bacterium]|nr:hypothetical protein [Polyangiaceae bacterium]